MDLFSIPEAARLIRASEITVRRKIKAGEIPHRKLGHRYFFTKDDLELYISQGAVPMRGEARPHVKEASNG